MFFGFNVQVTSVPKSRKSIFSLSNAVVAFGLIAGLLGIYSGFFYEKRAVLDIELLSNSPVLDVKEDVAELSIAFKGEQLRETKRVLSMLVVRVSNTGNASILQNYYDSEGEWGLLIHESSIVGIGLQNASSKYLEGKIYPLSISLIDPDRIVFPKMIFEAGQSFTVRILALHEETAEPNITAFGKIASIPENILIQNTYLENAQSSMSTAFSGALAIQIYRFVAYGLLGILFLLVGILLVFLVSSIGDWLERRRSKKGLAELLKIDGANDDEDIKRIIDLYRNGGDRYLRNLNFYIQDPERLKRFTERERKNFEDQKRFFEKRKDFRDSPVGVLSAEDLLLKYYAREDDESYIISSDFTEKLNRAMSILKIEGQSAGPLPSSHNFVTTMHEDID